MARKKRARPATAWYGFFIGFLVVAGLFAFSSSRYGKYLEGAELIAFDWRMYARGKQRPTGQVAIVAIDDESIKDIGRWPWPRSVMARLVDALRDYKVAVIGVDLFFTEADDQDVQRRAIALRLEAAGITNSTIAKILGPDNDEAFARAMREQVSTYLDYPFESHRLSGRRNEPILGGFLRELREPAPVAYNIVRTRGHPPALLSAEAYLPPIQILNEAARGSGYADIDADADGKTRMMMTAIRFCDRYCAPFFLALVSAYKNHAPLSLFVDDSGVTRVAVGDENVPVDEMGRMQINFRGKGGTIPRYSVSDLIQHRVIPSALAGKIVLVGVTASALGDRKVTPVDGDLPGVEVHANAIDNVLRGDFIYRSRLGDAKERIIAFLLGLTVSYALATLTVWWSLGTSVALAAGYFAYAQHRLHADGELLPLVFPMLVMGLAGSALVAYRYWTEGREKAFVRRVFEHYLHPDVIASLVDDRKELKLGGERRHLSILFADIMGFTSRAEKAQPEVLIAELNVYFTRMLNIVLAGGGVVDKLIGDAIMAFWGAPAEVPNPAKLAIDCALAMLAELDKLRKEDPRFADFDIGIGIATGDPVVGNLGGESRFDYSVIGDSVNFASRLEGLTRKFGVHLLVNKQTLDEAAGNYLVREVGLVRVKGKQELVPIVEVVGRAGDGGDPTFCQRFAEVRRLIAGGAHQEAVAALKQLGAIRPHDHVIELYLEQLDGSGGAAAEPPREMIFEFETK
ncbi:MAG: adenylate/guanylate cyclase domain-containing protein [Candidatus Binataceae bacterium]